jgi:hypothetical protein
MLKLIAKSTGGGCVLSDSEGNRTYNHFRTEEVKESGIMIDIWVRKELPIPATIDVHLELEEDGRLL